jgi:hypothetical protein
MLISVLILLTYFKQKVSSFETDHGKLWTFMHESDMKINVKVTKTDSIVDILEFAL